MFTQNLKITDQALHSLVEDKVGLSIFDMQPALAKKMVKNQTLHDNNFAFVTTTLAKLHPEAYNPIWNVTYMKDVPIDVGGGFVDFVSFYSVEWAGNPDKRANVAGNNNSIVPRVNANLNQNKVDVFTYQVAYDLKFIELEKLNKIEFTKSIKVIYDEAIQAGWHTFVEEIAYLGYHGNDGLFTNDAAPIVTLPLGTQDATQAGFVGMTDAEIVSTINGVLAYYLAQTNSNIGMLPDTFLMPLRDSTELSNRFSPLLTNTIRNFLLESNVGLDEARAEGIADYKIQLRGRVALDTLGGDGVGRMVVYKNNKTFVRLDIPYPIQLYTTLPDINALAYTSVFFGQVSQIQMPYNRGADTFGAVTYFDFTAPTTTP